MSGTMKPVNQFGMVLSRCVLAAVVTACGFSFSLACAQAPPNPKYTFTGSKACETCHKEIYDRWKNTLMANILVDPKQHPEVDRRRLLPAEPAGHIHQRRRRVHLWQQVEAALFHPRRRRLFRLPRAVGRKESRLAALLRRARGGLVGEVLSGRPHAAPDRAAVRRLPLHQLQHRDQASHRMERRLREMPRAGQRARQ